MLERVLFGGRGKNSAARADDVDDSAGDRAPPLAALRGAGDCAPPMECAGQRLKVQPEHAGAAGRKQAHRPAARWQIPLGVARGELVLVSQRGLGRGAELGRGPAAARLFGLFSASGVSADARRLGLTVRVREALYVCARGGTAREYRDAIRRAALAGVAVGTKYNHHSFMDLVEHLSVVCCRDLLANQLCQLLPGLGIPSDLALVWDGVSIGGAMWSRQETFCVLGVGFCDTAGRIHYRLVATPSENLQKAGPAQVDLVVASLQDHPAGLSRAVLRQRLSIVGGDGAIVGGGVDAKHSSTKAAELFWENIMGAAGGPPCTEWDLFHRVDAALSLVMRNHAAIAEVLDVGRSLGALFGTGDGRVLFRSTQKAIGSSQRVLPDQGGTRKIVAVAGSVDYIVTNLPALIASMHARLGLARSRKTAQSVGSLVDMGRRLSALNFVAFALAAADVLQRHIVPLALVAQQNDIGALSVWRRTASCQASLGEALATLSVIEDWWFVTALVGCMVSVADMARLWAALLISPLGRSFPRLVGATHHALWKQTYHGCTLHVDQAAAELDVRTLTLSPRCQCSSMRTRRSHGPRRALITLHGRRGPVAVRVPEWVAHSSLGAGFGVADVREGRGPRDVLPRYVRWAETAPPRELQGERRFCTAPAPCRCQVPPSLPNRLRALRQASRSCSAFLQSLRAALEDFSGARGASDHMLALGRDAALALNWGDLTSKPPTREQHLAFLRLARALKPALQRTLWPSTDVFPHVCCEWPAERGQNGWFQQFRELAQRLRRTARDPRCSWWRVEKWLVQPVIRTHVEASVGRLLAVAGAWQQPAARARLPAHRRVRWSAERFCWRCGGPDHVWRCPAAFLGKRRRIGWLGIRSALAGRAFPAQRLHVPRGRRQLGQLDCPGALARKGGHSHRGEAGVGRRCAGGGAGDLAGPLRPRGRWRPLLPRRPPYPPRSPSPRGGKLLRALGFHHPPALGRPERVASETNRGAAFNARLWPREDLFRVGGHGGGDHRLSEQAGNGPVRARPQAAGRLANGPASCRLAGSVPACPPGIPVHSAARCRRSAAVLAAIAARSGGSAGEGQACWGHCRL